ncbi:hypothetical protein M9M37_001850 [Escherichia coli]|uniref:hypothetical protein n=1 Tax=Escherichia coli TaxID=562 RepID=UPI0010E2751D|nr:hypothetical protein [Escherichia coli]EJF8031387.1 hypothetical protein [Escherichia coli]MDF1396572.1 hypothetical protein [Escherichia coli]GDF32141.1 hypothetical protein HmCmsJML270_00776 [Escherichia coli]HAL6342316.1 hypothetical protein [Escherichia coli]HAX4872291.1 hypothetical protein [Escherichia coli]
MDEQNKNQLNDADINILARQSIGEVLAGRIAAFSTSPKMLEIIDSKIESCVNGIVNDVFSNYSDFSKSTKEAFRAALPGNMENVIDLGRYNDMITQRLRETFASSGVADSMMVKAEKMLKEVMDESLLPPVIKLSEFLEAFIDAYAGQAAEDGWERPDIRLIDSEYSMLSHDYKSLYFDKSPDPESRIYGQRSQYRLDNNISMRDLEGETIDGHQVYEVYSAKIDERHVQHIVSTNLIKSRWKKMVFALYYGQSKICIDCDPDDYYYPCND